MAGTGAIKSHGITIKMGDGATPTENFTAIAELRNVTGPALTKSALEATTHASSAKEQIPGLKDPGTLTFPVNWIPTDPTHAFSSAAAASLGKDWLNDTVRHYQYILPNAALTTWLLTGWVQTISFDGAVDGILTGNITIVLTQLPTLV